MKINFILSVLCVGLWQWPLHAQQQAPPVEFSPQEVPSAAVLIEGGNPTNAFEAAIATLTTNGFALTKSDKRKFTIEMRKKKPGRPKEYDRVLVWFARDVAKPQVLKAYVLFGSYIEVFGTGGKIGRQVLDKDVEDEMTSSWRPPLIQALENTGE